MRLAISLKSNDGFTLAEVLVAMVIMMVGMVGLLQAINITLEQNLRNELRQQGVYLGEKYMNDLRGKHFERYSTTYTPFTVGSTVRGGGGRTFTVERVVRNIPNVATALNKELQVTVKWSHKNVEYQNRVVAPISQAPSN